MKFLFFPQSVFVRACMGVCMYLCVFVEMWFSIIADSYVFQSIHTLFGKFILVLVVIRFTTWTSDWILRQQIWRMPRESWRQHKQQQGKMKKRHSLSLSRYVNFLYAHLHTKPLMKMMSLSFNIINFLCSFLIQVIRPWKVVENEEDCELIKCLQCYTFDLNVDFSFNVTSNQCFCDISAREQFSIGLTNFLQNSLSI